MDASNVQKLRELVTRLAELNEEVKEIKAAKYELEQILIQDMDEAGLSLIRTKYGTLSTRSTVVASVKDWDAFEDYIYKNHALYLLQRRTSDPAYRELLATDGDIPGVEPFTKVSVSLTKAV